MDEAASPDIKDDATEPMEQGLGSASPDDEIQESQRSHSASIRFALDAVNLADHLEEDKLREIGAACRAGFETDLLSRVEWEKQMDTWTKLAIQAREQKSYPWPNASNIKYPLLSTAAMQFAARAYPSLVPSNGQIVKAGIIGKDADGQKVLKAERVSRYMSWQLMHEMLGWEEDMDKLLIMLPIVGTLFKKTYWCKDEQTNKSTLVYPKNLVVNYWARSLLDAERVSEIIEMSPRVLKERQLSKTFIDTDLGSAPSPNLDQTYSKRDIPTNDETTPYVIIEQHTYYDLDDSDYPKPYVVTFHRDSGKVLRIVPRFDEQTLVKDDTGEVVKVGAIQYYTKFGFIPNPDGGFYDLGFGMLLGPINESVNTIINQLVDAGSLSNLQSGFIGKGLRIRMGEQRFQPGEWKAVNSTADDLKKQIFPLPTKEPSNVLFQLMGSLITSGKELASVAEIFVGKSPGQNTPATTTMATIEQGMKVFTAVYKRVYRSLGEEYKKLYRLNEVYLNPNTYAQVLDDNVNPSDFKSGTYDIVPGADPTAVSQTEKLMKAQGLMELLPTGILDPVLVVQRVLEAQEQPNWEQLIHKAVQQSGQPPAPPPDPKMQELQMKGQLQQQAMAQKSQQVAQQSELAQRDAQTKQAMAQQEMANKQQAHEMDMESKAAVLHHATQGKMAQGLATIIASGAAQHQELSHKEQAHTQTMRHNEEISKSKQLQMKNSSTGKTRK
jgi:chaperonin GroES